MQSVVGTSSWQRKFGGERRKKEDPSVCVWKAICKIDKLYPIHFGRCHCLNEECVASSNLLAKEKILETKLFSPLSLFSKCVCPLLET